MFRPPNQAPFMFPQQPYQSNFLQGMAQRAPLSNQAINPTGLQGLLQRFFPSSTMMSGGGGSNLMGTLNNVQQVLRVAQSATPLIKEYGPMIKNAPKLVSMMKALNEINNEDEEDEEPDTEDDEVEVTQEEDSNEIQNINSTSPRRGTGESKPKLFI